MLDLLAFVSGCTSDVSLTSNADAIVNILEISKSVGAKIYPLIAGLGIVAGITKVI